MLGLGNGKRGAILRKIDYLEVSDDIVRIFQLVFATVGIVSGVSEWSSSESEFPPSLEGSGTHLIGG